MATTFQDMIDHLVDYVGDKGSDAVVRDCKRATLEAYRDLTNAHRWSYLYTHGRVHTLPPYSTGTITYDHAGGQHEMMATLSGGSWPTYAAGCYLRVGQSQYKVAARLSATVVILDSQVNPGGDLDAGTEYELYCDTYLLPEDYIAQDQAMYERNFGGMDYVHPREWLAGERFGLASGIPRVYTIVGDPIYPGRLTLKVSPWPIEVRAIDYVYHRRPRPLALALEKRGSVTVASASNVLAGTGTAFAPAMVGSVIRLGSDGKLPTSVIDSNPAAFETRITGYIDATHVTVADPAPVALTAVAFTVSDVVDIEEGAMLNAFFRCGEKCIAQNRTLKDKPSARQQYLSQLAEARSADSRSFAGRHAGPASQYRPRLRDFPQGPDDIN